jgi:hypothetical protein
MPRLPGLNDLMCLSKGLHSWLPAVIRAHPQAIVDLSVGKWIELMKSVWLPIGMKNPYQEDDEHNLRGFSMLRLLGGG